MMSSDGKIIGFQPTNRVAVNNWAANPLAKELYGGKKLSPGTTQSAYHPFINFTLMYHPICFKFVG